MNTFFVRLWKVAQNNIQGVVKAELHQLMSKSLNRLLFIMIIFLTCMFSRSIAQDTPSPMDSTEVRKISRRPLSFDFSVRHYPTDDDSVIYKKYIELIDSEPSDKDYQEYYWLACSLWELSKLVECERMFMKIANSKKTFYSETYRRASDLTSDTSTNLYGYGSYTYNFKNSACLYLSKINLENKRYDQALKFTKLADKKYKVTFSCGTGAQGYYNQLQGLYSLCYYGLEMYDVVIEKYLHDYSDWNNGILVKSIRRKYTKSEIENYLRKAEESIDCKVDNFQSSTFTVYGFGSKAEKTSESRYTSGKATINLFGLKVDMPRPDLANGEIASRELFVKEFRESGFYNALTKDIESR